LGNVRIQRCLQAGNRTTSHGASPVAEARGDKQPAKEMAVFAKRIEKQLGTELD
jgi:hypothetical protein